MSTKTQQSKAAATLVLFVAGLTQYSSRIIDMKPYTPEDFSNDIYRMTEGRADPALANVLVSQSRETVGWLKENGIIFELSFNRQAYKVDGRYKFWGGMARPFSPRENCQV
jgi:succinate dehydrogenase/fumarate reductase flavoprotein subunit